MIGDVRRLKIIATFGARTGRARILGDLARVSELGLLTEDLSALDIGEQAIEIKLGATNPWAWHVRVALSAHSAKGANLVLGPEHADLPDRGSFFATTMAPLTT